MDVHERARKQWGMDFRIHGTGASTIRCVDVTDVARKLGFETQVAVTQEAWDDSVRWNPGSTADILWPQIQSERLWSLLAMARLAITNAAGRFWLLRVSNHDAGGLGLSRLTIATGRTQKSEPTVMIGLDREYMTAPEPS
jgi:hypothetical protein